MSKYKYLINHRLSLLPKGLYPDNIVELLEKDYGIRESDFDRDRFLEPSDSTEIPADRLMVYANLFKVQMEELFAGKRVAFP
jgi:hypothetical protein